MQGLTHLGKGTLTLCPYHSDRQLMSQVAVAGLLTVLVSFLDVKNSKTAAWLICINILNRTPIKLLHLFIPLHIFVFPLFCSYFGKVPLRPVRPCSSNAAPYACHIRRGAPASSCIRPCGTGVCVWGWGWVSYFVLVICLLWAWPVQYYCFHFSNMFDYILATYTLLRNQ